MGNGYDGPKIREIRRRARRKADAMAALYREGWTLQRIGDEYGISRERVRQLISKYTAATAKNCGYSKATADRRAAKKMRRDAKCLSRHGCTDAQHRSIPIKARRAFQRQRANAHQRDIGWQLNLWQWWTFWQASGRWEQRGRGQGYVMCRYGDEGPYSLDNIFIAPHRHNSSEQKRKKSNLPIGVSRRGGKFLSQRQINGTLYQLGTFSTPGAAHAAYLRAGQQLHQQGAS